MLHLPNYITLLFMLAVLLTVWLFYRSSGGNQKVLYIIGIWCVVLSLLGLTGFFTVTGTVPPRMALLVLPPLFFITLLLTLKQGKTFADKLDINSLALLHIVRIPVEVVLYALVVQKVMPELMTFGGRNYDIISGVTAPVIYYFGFVRRKLGPVLLLAWNILCLGILLFTVMNGILSVPGPFQQFAFDQPNIAVLYFPFVLLPGVIVPLVFLAHLVTIRKLVKLIRLQQRSHLAVSM